MGKATLVVMAAGMGSRFGGLKQIEPIGPGGEALLDFSVFDAKRAGFDKVVFIIKKQIEQDFKSIVGSRIEKQGIDVEYVFQETNMLPEGYTCPETRQKPWGTGHAILCCKGVVNEPFVVVNADDYYGVSAYQSIYDYLMNNPENNYCMVGYRLGNTVTENGTVSRGVCQVEDGFLKTITEHTKIAPDGLSATPNGDVQLSLDTVVSMNMWGFTPDIFDHLQEGFEAFLAENINSEKGEYLLPFLVDDLIKAGKKNVAALTTEDKWYGVTYKEDKEPVVKAIKALCDANVYPFK
ncbi:MAG: nucleotidyltransferase [Clostridia bacterium]|nr:nucleotidyltransferase [Clostridia bacterium]